MLGYVNDLIIVKINILDITFSNPYTIYCSYMKNWSLKIFYEAAGSL